MIKNVLLENKENVVMMRGVSYCDDHSMLETHVDENENNRNE